MDGTDFDQIAAFLATVDHAGFTAAGAALNRDGSLVSRRVTALEKRLGVRLLERTTRRVALTEAGEAYYQRMRKAVQVLGEIDTEAVDAAGAVRGTLRLSLPATFGRMWIAPILPAFLRQYPGLTVEARYEDRYVDLVAEGFDVAVRIGELADSRLIARKLAPASRLLCASPDYLAERGMPVHPSDLAQHDCIGFSRLASHPIWHLGDDGKTVAVRISGPLVTDDATSLIQAAVAGVGIAMVSDWLAGPELKSGRLVPVLPDHPVVTQESVYIVHPSAKLVPAKTRIFMEWLATGIQQSFS
ncbi:LysR substrate-binding domain-containing protein [Aureimonas altamirensis]|uniref:LysR family transcriptional regulator n=1 Tax=Aureimonas altamirensis TaxID=370622 RepID=UPI001E3B66C8|nr:LysR family transcriptional regulator [Aureimonas altamirensis]UHD44128.1 LysR substrate-binding domain-containing protein [Aureimonas altamirensis]